MPKTHQKGEARMTRTKESQQASYEELVDALRRIREASTYPLDGSMPELAFINKTAREAIAKAQGKG